MISLSHRQLLERIPAIELVSGTITSPLELIDFVVPVGFTKFTLELIGFQLSAEDGPAFAVSLDGTTFINDTVNADSYLGFINNVVLQHITTTPNTGNSVQNATDATMSILPNLEINSKIGLDVEIDIFPGDASRLAKFMAWSSAFDSSNNQQLVLSQGIGCLNPFAIIPTTPQRIVKFRMTPYGNNDMNPPTSGETFIAGSYILTGRL